MPADGKLLRPLDITFHDLRKAKQRVDSDQALVVICRAPAEVAGSMFPAERPDPARPLGLDPAACRRFEDEAARQLAAAGGCVILAPHLYDLWCEHEAVRRLSDTSAALIVAAWLAPRPALWTLRAHGLGEPREIVCFDMRTFETPDALVAGMRDAAPAAFETAEPGLVEIDPDAPARWYPVLDYERCVDCKQCHEFCMFGVYSIEDGRVLATQPDNCKPGCPACARVCPKAAIMFPHYLKDPGIAGEPGAEIASEGIDVDAFFERRAALAKEAAKPAEEERDDLDDLIDQLDELDR